MHNFYKIARVISQETGVQMHVDHIQPLSRGGEHRYHNLQITTAEANMQKHNKWATP